MLSIRAIVCQSVETRGACFGLIPCPQMPRAQDVGLWVDPEYTLIIAMAPRCRLFRLGPAMLPERRRTPHVQSAFSGFALNPGS